MTEKDKWPYDPRCGEYSQGYSGDLNDDAFYEDFEGRDAKVDATRKEFGKPIPAGEK